MLFEKVKKEHILQGIKDYEENGLPNEFGASSTYNLVYENKTYPPKAIMAYANYHAEGRKIELYFKGGLGTDCFKAFERNGFKVEKKNNAMTKYKEYEKEVYDWLISKNRQDPNFTFSLRMNGSKGAELDYFIGTEKSSYFGTTFWSIPVTYKGASTDCINLIFGFSNESYRYNFEFKQTKSPTDEQNRSVLSFVESLKESPIKTLGFTYVSPENNKMFDLKTGQKQSSYSSLETMLKDIESDLEVVIPAVNEAIQIKKEHNPELKAHRITQKEFKKMQTKLEKRFAKYSKKNALKNQSTIIKEQFSNWLKEKENSNKVKSYLRAIDILNETLDKEIYLEKNIAKLTLLYQDLIENQKDEKGKYFYAAAPSYGNNGFYSASVKAFKEFLKNGKNMEDNLTSSISNYKAPLNQIFYGPPGTGKTYHTINEAIKIVDPAFYAENKNNRDKLKERFKLLSLNSNDSDNGQIGFSTFHQSFSYEDFVEGIKPVEPQEGDAYLKYKIEEGIFKKICRLASDSLKAVVINSDSLISLTAENFAKSDFYKMSLGNSQENDDQDIFDYCVENNCMSIGFGEGLDFTGKDERELKIYGRDKGLGTYPIQAINLFKNYLKLDNYIVVSKGNNYVRAIGRVVGEYEYIEDSPFPNNPTFNHFRKVEWLFNDKEISAKEIYNKNLSQQTIYKLVKNEIKEDFFVKEKKVNILKLPRNPKDFVLIIDEINRGNVSSIFGELITLIEKDKRAGKSEELSVILPYSKKEFKVPRNVYVIGTMNTADRSIEALDTALRRRFSFREMPPKSYLISDESKLKNTNGVLDNHINVVAVLDTINNRIEKLIDKDHKIGHSYFMDIETKHDLVQAFKNKVIPLLEEYFFGDFGKIGLVLGNSFITKTGKENVEFAEFDEYDSSIRNDLMERSIFEITKESEWNFESIYTKLN